MKKQKSSKKYKLKQSDYNNVISLYKRLNLIENNRVMYESLLINKADVEKFKKSYIARVKKKNKNLSIKDIKDNFHFNWFMYGPCYDNSVKPGHFKIVKDLKTIVKNKLKDVLDE